MAGLLGSLAKWTATAALVSITVADLVGNIGRIQGESMQPALNPGSSDLLGALKADIVFYEKLSAPAYKYSRGDVVLLRSPTESTGFMIKRLIALQGDWINVPGSYDILQVPKGRCWVEGDNGSISSDSRTFGPIPLALVRGRVTHKIWPPSRVGRVERILPAGRVMQDDQVMGP